MAGDGRTEGRKDGKTEGRKGVDGPAGAGAGAGERNETPVSDWAREVQVDSVRG
jgi:hypothetical protein